MIDFASLKSMIIPEGVIKKITANSVVLWEKKPEYKILEYLEFDGSSYVDTGYIPADNESGKMDCSITFELNNTTNGIKRLYGCFDGTNYGQTVNYQMLTNTESNMISMTCGSSNRAGRYTNIIGQKITVETYNHATYMGWKSDFAGLTSMMEGAVTGNPAVNLPMYLGKCNGNTDEGIVGKIYSFKIAKYHYPITIADDKLVRHFVPCKRIEDGVLGMFDLLSDVFYPGTGNIVAGPEVA